VKAHLFFHDIDWSNVTSQEAQFIPQVTDPESTDYFDPRGAKPQAFHEDDNPETSPGTQEEAQSLAVPVPIARDSVGSPSSDDFGAFSFKNLGVLKQANDDVIRKLKIEHMQPLSHTLSEPATTVRRKSLSQRIRKPPSVLTGSESRPPSMNPPTNPPSPSTSVSSVASSPSYSSIGPSTPGSHGSHARRTSEHGVLDRFKLGTQPSRLRTASVSSVDPGSSSDQWPSPIPRAATLHGSSESSDSSAQRRSSQTSQTDRAVTVLVAEDNPISAKVTLQLRCCISPTDCWRPDIGNDINAYGMSMHCGFRRL
jgi:serine/threonine-protein kinase RIM15